MTEPNYKKGEYGTIYGAIVIETTPPKPNRAARRALKKGTHGR